MTGLPRRCEGGSALRGVTLQPCRRHVGPDVGQAIAFACGLEVNFWNNRVVQ